MLIAFLHSVYGQMSDPKSLFQLLSVRPSWTDEELPALLFSADTLGRPIRTGFEDNIRTNVLTLGKPLNGYALLFLYALDTVNTHIFGAKAMVNLPSTPTLSRSQAVSNELKGKSEYFKTLHEHATLVGTEALHLFDFLLSEEQFSVRLGKLFGLKRRIHLQFDAMAKKHEQATEILRSTLDPATAKAISFKPS